MAATGVAAEAEGAIAGMPAPTGCRRRHAGSHRLHGWRWQDSLAVGAAMAATGVAALAKVPVAGMPAPTDRMAGHGSTCGSCHGSDRGRGISQGSRRWHAGSHRLHGWRWQDLLAVGAAMAATGVAAVAKAAVAGMPAPTARCCARCKPGDSEARVVCGACSEAHWPRARAISASIWSGSFGTSALSTCAAPRVTTTSSSMRTPIPRQRRSTPLASAAT